MDNSYYFVEYDEEEDEYIVYFGTNNDEFNAAWIAAFIKEEDANEYVDFKNDVLDRNPNNLDDDILIDPEWDESMEDDLFDRFTKEFGELKD